MEIIASAQERQQLLDDYAGYLERERWTRQQLEEYQGQALRACREYAYAHSPFYQRFHCGLMDRPLHELPVVTKAMMKEHFDELVTDRAIRFDDLQEYIARADGTRLFLDRYQVTTTSGSTGQPAFFLYDREEGAIRAKTFMRSSRWAGVTPQSKSAAVASPNPLVLDGQRAVGLHLTATDPVETLVQRLNEWQPDSLVGFSSIISTLAHEQREGRLRIRPRAIFCAADTLTSEMRRRIEEAWQTKIFVTYGATEGGILAAECAFHQGLHLFEDFSIVEVVDHHNRPVAPGEQGEKVLLTVLFRRTQPLIRFEVTDLVRTSTVERCACGRPFALLEGLQGRMIEVLYLPSPTGKEEAIHPYLFENAFNKLPVSAWQVVQELDGLHIFLTGAATELRDEHVLDTLRQALTKRGVLVPPLAVHRVTALSRNASGKTPTVLLHVPRPAA